MNMFVDNIVINGIFRKIRDCLKLDIDIEERMFKMRIKVIFIFLALLFISGAANATQRLVLCEKYTNTSCGPCYNANQTMDQLIAAYPDHMAVIRYHVDWPSDLDPFYLYNPSENGIRTNYYGIGSVPHLQVGGIHDAGSHTQYWSVISNRYTVPSALEIVIDGTFNESSRTGNLSVTATATDAISLEGLFLRVVLTESGIPFNAPNGINYHHQTMRYMFPYSLGTRVYLTNPGDVAEVELDIWAPEPLNLENCELVAFVQSESNREVLQAAKLPLMGLTLVDIEDEQVELPTDFRLEQNYPNPFNAGTVISYRLSSDSPVELTIYDILGKKIMTLIDENQAAGHYSVNWNGLDSDGKSVASGVYLYRLKSEGRSQSKRMMLVK